MERNSSLYRNILGVHKTSVLQSHSQSSRKFGEDTDLLGGIPEISGHQ